MLFRSVYKIQRSYKPRNIQHVPHFFSLPLFNFFLHLGGAIYYINLACTPFLLSKISPTLYPTFQMYPTFYIMFFHVPHFLHPLLYNKCTPIFHVFYILYHILGANSKQYSLTYFFHKMYLFH